MRSILVILFLSTITPSAFAEEPTTTPTVASIAARDAYKVSLRAQLEKSGEDEAEGKCGAAKSSYRSAESELTRINAELAIPANTAIGQVQVDYRAKLEALKRTEEAKIAKAKTDAKTAGTELTAAKAKVKAIEAEIVRIEAQEKREEAASRPASYTDGLGGLGTRERDSSGLGYSSSGYGLGGSLYEPSSKPSPLPEEFKGCFPSEVSS